MLLGEKQTLTVTKFVDFGIYLSEDENGEEVLLPKKQVPPDIKLGDKLEIFLYKDSKDRLIATTTTPLITLGRVAKLKVVQLNKVGAFLDWGLEKDLLLPFKEQTKPVQTGEEVLVALYTDKSSRLCATMKIYHYLPTAESYGKDERVAGIVYEISREFGAFVAVDEKYSALIPVKEMYGNIQVGQTVSARVTRVHPDGKLDLSLREKAYLQIEKDGQLILKAMEEKGGYLPFTDKADAEVIRDEMGMSKNEFKRAIGHLLKQGRIEIGTEKIILKSI